MAIESTNRQVTTSGPFSLGFSKASQNPIIRKLLRLIESPIEKALSLEALNREYNRASSSPGFEDNFPRVALEHLGIRYNLDEESLARIPKEGPVVIVANHPFGGIEGIVMCDLIRSRRPDGKILVNYLLKRVPQLNSDFIFVDPFGAQGAAKRNLQPMREAIEGVKNGGLLTIFPSGTVSHLHPKQTEITDPVWSPTVARLLRKTKAQVVPIFFEGNNGLPFQLAGLVHPLLRTALIPRELYNKRNSELSMQVGNPIPFSKLEGFSDEDMMGYLRLRTYMLSKANHSKSKKGTAVSNLLDLEPLIEAIPSDRLENEVSKIPENQRLLSSGKFKVFYAKAHQIPYVLREIGRLRELAFREVQEGTGKSIDLDRFDNYYLHLFVWDEESSKIVGAYRIVQTDKIVRTYGKRALYTHTLFSYRSGLIKQMGPALELGRSFVNPEYQRNFNSLQLLWKGIGTFVVRNPDYRVLFGTVSISSEYESMSRVLIASFLRANKFLPELAKGIRARNPLRQHRVGGSESGPSKFVVKDLREVSELITEIEAKQKSIPVLLKQYLKLGGKLLGFNIDENFGNVLDGLIYIDLCETDPRILHRYLGKEGTNEFLAYHQAKPPKTGTIG
jgi:putative hemolysin